MHGIRTIDCDYIFPEFAASFLVVEKGRAAFIETNTAQAVPKLLDALEKEGLKPDAVDLIIVTHAHLDHAGGTSELLSHCPNAKVLAHPKAARTLISPEKLIASAIKTYGESRYNLLYGNIVPIAAERVRVMQEGETLKFGSREFRFIYTLGHATHHFCIYDSASKGVFTGDSFGIRYPSLQRGGLFIFPSTSPIDFDPLEAKKSLQKILATGAQRVFLTHFGELNDLKAAAVQMTKHLDFHEALLKEAIKSNLLGERLAEFCEKELVRYFAQCLSERGFANDPKASQLINLDVQLNAAGIAFVAQRQRNA